jgi:cyclic pyranopterin phosphate synthase
MVDVGGKPVTHRIAVAEAELLMKAVTLRIILKGNGPKGSVLEVARVAGIHAAKQTSSLIPLCHPLALTKVGIEFSQPSKTRLRIVTRTEAVERTGVEMEALTAASVCALTVYDMCKAIDRGMEICRIRLLEKSGGKSGPYMRTERRKR